MTEMETNKRTYSDKEIYDALKMIRDICKNNGGSCRDCKLSYSENGIHIPYCGVGDTPDVWRFTEPPSEWKPFEKEEAHG